MRVLKLVFRGHEVPHKIALLARRMPGVVNDALYLTAADMRRDFELTTYTWDHKVKFTIQQHKRGWKVFTKDDIYRFVDLGTRPHIIKAKRAKVLEFQGGYAAKTRPGVIGSTGGGPSGDMQYAKVVHHPGTKARRFTQIIYRKFQKQTGPRVQKAIKYGTEAVGL